MRELLGTILDRLLGAPDLLVYLVLGLLAALENLIPPIPADVIILFGGVLAGRGRLEIWTVFAVVWTCNVLSALLTYGLGRRYGPSFFAGRLGHLILRPGQLVTLGAFYQRFGSGVIFVSRFLPGFRAVVPAFAGVAGVRFWTAAIPVATASALWYGFVVWLGFTFGSNWEQILGLLQRSGRWAAWVALLALAALLVWWWRSRGEGGEEG